MKGMRWQHHRDEACVGNWTFVKDTLSPGVCVYSLPVRVKYQHPVPFIGGIVRYFGGT